MGTINYDLQANSKSLSYQLDAGEALDTVVKGMLDMNRIPGVLQPVFSQVDDDSFFRYDVTGMNQLQELLQGGIKLRTLIKVMLGVAESLDQSQEYLIPGCAFLLEPEDIFVDPELNTGLICLPVLREEQNVSYSGFFLDLLTRNRVNTDQNDQYYSSIINYLNEYRNNFSLREFCNLLQRYWDEIRLKQGGGSSANAEQAGANQGGNGKKSPAVDDITRFLKNRANGGGGAAVKAPGDGPAPRVPVVPSVVKEDPGSEQKDTGKKKAFSFGNVAKDLFGGKSGGKSGGGKDAPPKTNKPPRSTGNKPAVGGGFIPGRGKVNGGVTSGPRPAVRPEPRRAEQAPRAAEPEQPASQPIQTKERESASRDSGLSFGKTVFISGMSEGTQIIESPRKAREMPVCRLIRSSTGEVYTVNQPAVSIGRDREYADCCIEDNGHVSAKHARIEFRDGQFVLMDTNSSNGTFVNGRRLREREIHVLKDKDNIVFGNENFVFQME